MNEQLQWLIQLQEKDTSIAQIQERTKTLPQRISSLQAKLLAAQDELSQATTALQSNESGRRSLERDLKELEEKISKFKGKTQEIKTNKEYQTLLKEIEQVEGERSGVEEKILFLMEEADKLREVIVSRKKWVQEEEKVYLGEKEKVESEFAVMTQDLETLKQGQSDISQKVEPSLVPGYQKLLATRKGLAVVPLRGEHCSGCHMNIPPQFYTEVKKNDKIHHCPNCLRVLYWVG